MRIELTKTEIYYILEGLDMFRDQLKEDSTLEIPYTQTFYDVWDLMDKLTKKSK